MLSRRNKEQQQQQHETHIGFGCVAMDGCDDSAKIVSAINDRERRNQQQKQTTERRQRAATYIDENHDFCSKSEIGVSAVCSFCSFIRFVECTHVVVAYCRFLLVLSKVEAYRTVALVPWWWN
jgi:hypothetical protein